MLLKNNLTSESPFFERASHTHNLLRVFEAVRAGEGAEALGDLYAAFGEHIHQRGESLVPASELLAEARLPASFVSAYDDSSWDAVIAASMADGLSLTGPDVGTPILGFQNSNGKRVGFFGPVISRRVALEDGLKLWDGLMLTAGIDCFWELKRTRTESPDFTPIT